MTTTPHDSRPLATDKKIDEFYELVDGIELAMLTTINEDGNLVSRAMQTQERRDGVDLWFVTSTESEKVSELEARPAVNVSYIDHKSRSWVSVSGRAQVIQSRELVRQLYKPDWKAWFPDDGGARNGGPDDPRIVVIEIDANEVVYSKTKVSRPVALFKVLAAMATGNEPDIADVRHLDPGELAR